MRGAILLSIVTLCGLVGNSQATTCTETTLYTCQKSLLMTGKCESGVCTCVSSDYIPGPFGCQRRQKAEITSNFNGQIETGASAELTCSAGIGEYEWLHNGEQIQETAPVLQMTGVSPSDDGDYTCTSKIAGIPSEESDPFTITVLDTTTTKPVVEGMASAMLAGDKVQFTCVAGQRFVNNPTYKWFFRGVFVSDYSYLDHLVETMHSGEELSCSINDDSSEVVTFPDTIATDIVGVEIIPAGNITVLVDQSVTLQCKLTGGFPEQNVLTTIRVYKWKKDNEIIDGANTETLIIKSIVEAHAGSYVCTAEAGENMPKESSPVTLTVKKTIGLSSVQRTTSYPLTKGYFSLSCDYKTVNTLLPVTYKWFKDGVELLGVTDKILQLNDASADYGGDYWCQVTSDDGMIQILATKVIVKDSSDISSNKVWPGHGRNGIFGVGETVPFYCDNVKHDTPGLIYSWSVDGVKQAGEISKDFEYTFTSTAYVDIACDYTFDEHTSQSEKRTYQPRYTTVYIRVNDVFLDPLRPVEGSKVTLTCKTNILSESAEPITYQWKEDESVIPGETDQTYEVVAGAAGSEARSFVCEATSNSVTETSLDQSVVPQANPNEPGVFVDVVDRSTEVIMRCMSVSHSDEATFEWFKDGNVIPDATSFRFTIDDFSESDHGVYSCKITVKGKSATSFNSFEGTYQDLIPHIAPCQWARECDKPNMDPTVCVDNKCQCLPGYVMMFQECYPDPYCQQASDCDKPNMDPTVCVDNMCQCLPGYVMMFQQECSGSVTVMGSLLMVLSAILAHKIL